MTKHTLTGLDDKLGKARLVGLFNNTDREWHDLRRTGIGGSDVAPICGLSPWTSPFALWAKKTGRIPDDFVPSEAAEWGTRLESVIIDKLVEQHPELKVYRDVGTWANIERPWQLANPDAIFEQDGELGIIEIKTSRFEDDWRSSDGYQLPSYYRTQVQWYLQTFGFKRAIVAVLFSGSKYVEIELQADQFEQEANLQAVERFRSFIETDTQPDFDGALSTLEVVRELHPDISDDEVELGQLGALYFRAVDALAEAESSVNEAKSRVLDAMGSAKRGLIDGEWKVTRQARGGGKPFIVNKKG